MPDKEQRHGRAWRLDNKAIEEYHRKKGTWHPHTSVCGWLVEALWAHPLWGYYCIACYHLRQVEGIKDPKIYLEDATHEMVLFALSPDEAPNLLDPMATHLTPSNFAAQFIAGTDIQAEQKIEKCVDEIIMGILSPDTDFLREWVKRFNGAMLK